MYGRMNGIVYVGHCHSLIHLKNDQLHTASVRYVSIQTHRLTILTPDGQVAGLSILRVLTTTTSSSTNVMADVFFTMESSITYCIRTWCEWCCCSLSHLDRVSSSFTVYKCQLCRLCLVSIDCISPTPCHGHTSHFIQIVTTASRIC